MATRNGFSVREFTRQHGISINKLAQHVGVHRRTVVRWNAGDSKPSPLAMEKIQELRRVKDSEASNENRQRTSDNETQASTRPRRPSLLPSIG